MRGARLETVMQISIELTWKCTTSLDYTKDAPNQDTRAIPATIIHMVYLSVIAARSFFNSVFKRLSTKRYRKLHLVMCIPYLADMFRNIASSASFDVSNTKAKSII